MNRKYGMLTNWLPKRYKVEPVEMLRLTLKSPSRLSDWAPMLLSHYFYTEYTIISSFKAHARYGTLFKDAEALHTQWKTGVLSDGGEYVCT